MATFTRSMYDSCALREHDDMSTYQLRFALDRTKYVNNNLKPDDFNSTKSQVSLVEIESNLRGTVMRASNCTDAKYPLCAKKGCLLTHDPRIGRTVIPAAYERGRDGDNHPAVVKTNMKKMTRKN